jgi:predicted transposase/invertase (TIGR01784 family)
MKFVDVTNDIAFRKIFGNEEKKISLISFLNAVIKLPDGNNIEDVNILNPYQFPKLAGGKATILDVKARDKRGNTFIVEMQVAEMEHFHKRVLYYTSQSYVGQIDKGIEYKKLNPAYFIGILEFNIGTNPNYFCRHQVLDVETKERVLQDIEFHFIELEKFNLGLDQLKTSIDQWTYFIKNAENLDVIPSNLTDEGLREAYKEADKHNWTKEELEEYERANIKEGDDINRLEFAMKKVKRAVAKAMKDANEPTEKIMKYTGLTKEEIAKL